MGGEGVCSLEAWLACLSLKAGACGEERMEEVLAVAKVAESSVSLALNGPDFCC